MEIIDEQKEEPQQSELQKDQKKFEKIEKEKRELLNKVLSGNIDSTRERVGYILNNYPEARNSDIELAWNYWKTFESEILGNSFLTKKQLHELTKIPSLCRARAKIQNEYKLFQADDIVKKHRGILEEENKTQAIEDKPKNLPIYSVFIDESGKTQQFLSIGSLWNVDAGAATYKTSEALIEWKIKRKIDYEFHFSEVNKFRLQDYKDFFVKFLGLNPTIGFKIIIINNQGFRDVSSAITDLTFHLISKGIEHENKSGRAPLPRTLQIWLDEEAKGSDRLKLENLRERISNQKIEGLYLEKFDSVSSKGNYYIQAVDLFTAAVNRKLHNQSNEGHIKDELADYILALLKFDVKSINKINSDVDKSIVFNLAYLGEEK